MIRKSQMIFVLLLLIFLASCNVNNPKLDINIDSIPEDTKSDKMPEVIRRITVTYEKYNKIDGIKPIIIEDMAMEQNLFVYEARAKNVRMYGVMDHDFNIMSEPISESPIIYNNGLALVEFNSEYIIINEELNKVSELKDVIYYDNQYVLVDSKSYVPYRLGEFEFDTARIGLFDFEALRNIKADEYLVPSVIYINPISGEPLDFPKVGYRTFADEYINNIEAGENFVIPPMFDRGKMFFDGIARVRKDDKTGYIDEKGAFIIESNCDVVIAYYGNSIFAVVDYPNDDNKRTHVFGLIDRVGNEITELKYNTLVDKDFVEGFLRVMYDNERWNIVDLHGKELLAYSAYSISQFTGGRALITMSNASYFIDTNGRSALINRF